MHKDLLSTAEAAEALGVTPSAISRMVAREELRPQLKAPGIRGPMFFDADEVNKLARSRAEADEEPEAVTTP